MKPLVMKFGGTSVADRAAMEQAGRLVADALPRAPLVVLSAMAGTTDGLFAAARAALGGGEAEAVAIARSLLERHRRVATELVGQPLPPGLEADLAGLAHDLEMLLSGVARLRELTPRSMDAIAAFGERLSTRVFAAHLGARGLPVEPVDARDWLRTDGSFGAAQPDAAAIRERARAAVAPRLGPGRVVLTQGYIGATAEGLTTTLGRGGSDYSAALLGAALGAGEVQIWTDVEGVMTADPRLVPTARPLPSLSFAEAAELAAFGAKVLHPATIQPAVEASIPVTVRHTRRPGGHFTTITATGATTGRPVTAIAAQAEVSVLTVTSSRMLQQAGFLARLFEVFGRHQVSVDLVATAEVSVSLTVDAGVDLKPLIAELSTCSRVEASEGRAILAVIGEQIKHTPGIGARIFAALGDINVEMVSMGANEINLSLVVRGAELGQAINRLHAALIEERPA